MDWPHGAQDRGQVSPADASTRPPGLSHTPFTQRFPLPHQCFRTQCPMQRPISNAEHVLEVEKQRKHFSEHENSKQPDTEDTDGPRPQNTERKQFEKKIKVTVANFLGTLSPTCEQRRSVTGSGKCPQDHLVLSNGLVPWDEMNKVRGLRSTREGDALFQPKVKDAKIVLSPPHLSLAEHLDLARF